MVRIMENDFEPTGVIVFKYKVAMYKQDHNAEFHRLNNYFELNEPYKVIAVYPEYIELEGGLISLELRPEQFDLSFGELLCNDKTPVCNRAGTILRYVDANTVFKIRELLEGIVGIGNREYISLKNAVEYKALK